MTGFKVTPWEVSGNVDYNRLIKEFGTQKINDSLKKDIKKECGELHPMLRRNFFFSHRDMDRIMEDHRSGRGFFLYTGRKPSKGMHIGHLVPMLFTSWLQKKFDVNLYIEITDDEGFLHKKERTWEGVREAAHENIKDIIAAGFDPDKTFIFKDSEYIRNMYPLAMKAARKITTSTVKAVFGFTDSTNIGIQMYPAIQTTPTFFEKKRCLIPCAIDQDNYWRIQRDIAEGLGHHKTAAIHSRFIPPLQGMSGKMSSSAGSETCILLDDDEKTVERKINRHAFSGGQPTIEEHRRKGGNPDVDIPFQWLRILFEPDDDRLKQIEEGYRSGEILTGQMKRMLIEEVNRFLNEHRDRRENADMNRFMYNGKLAEKMWECIHE